MSTSEVPAEFRHAAARPGPLRLLRDALDDILSRRRLVGYLVRADIRKKGADTILGNLWWVLDPLLQMVVYVVFVSIIFDRTTPDYPLFVLAAILPWKWFTSSLNDATVSVTSQGSLIRQIQFPKIVLPMASTGAAVVGFAFSLIPLGAIMLLYPERISPYLLLIPVIAVVQFLFTLGASFIVAGVNVFFRDLGNVLRHFLRLWFYLSPGLYSLTMLEESGVFDQYPVILRILQLNPFATLFEAYRAVIYGHEDPALGPHLPDFAALGALTVASLLLVAIGGVIFKRLEPMFAKVL
ncbi:MAG TPA: ABC transporter permease [Candidatus Limnocylindrales bacterium]|jgi:ABC-type polysaccharide/polyol phosphate export permease